MDNYVISVNGFLQRANELERSLNGRRFEDAIREAAVRDYFRGPRNVQVEVHRFVNGRREVRSLSWILKRVLEVEKELG